MIMVDRGMNPEHVFYRSLDGQTYARGLNEDAPIWCECGYQPLGPMRRIRREVEIAREKGLKQNSIAWHLLTDVERDQRVREVRTSEVYLK